MKLACASGALDSSFVGGDLTQLEFLDLCAHELACDGVVLDVRHFPRTDSDYLAQVKKMAADRGLTIAALAEAAFFGFEQARMAQTFEVAAAIGAPLVAGELVAETGAPWSEQLAKLNAATSLAKSFNVTLALRNAAGTFAGSTHDCKRVTKEADSAWLRFGPRPSAFGPADDPSQLAPNTVLLWSGASLAGERSIAETLHRFPEFRGHLAVDAFGDHLDVAAVRATLRAWRAALASLDRT
ncbi:MAG: hypothetical protein WCD38_10050 [Candidatus Tumulicola sp.]